MCYKIKNKSNINTRLPRRPSRAGAPAPRAPQPGGPLARLATATSAVWSGVGTETRGVRLAGTPRSYRRGRAFSAGALSAWKRRKVSGVPGEVGSGFQIILGGGGGSWSGDCPPLSVEFSAGNLRLRAPAPCPSPGGLFPVFFSLLSPSPRGRRRGRRGRPAPARVPGGGARPSAVQGAPRAAHHLAEPLLKAHPSVCSDAAFLPEKNHC